MNKIRISEFEVSEIEKQIDNKIEKFERITFNYNDMKQIAKFSAMVMLDLLNQKLETIEFNTMSTAECADVLQSILSLVNDDKYKPLIDFLQKIGGE